MERLDAERIPCERKRIGLCIDHGDGIHPSEQTQAISTHPSPQLWDYGTITVASNGQVVTSDQLREVIDLPIEDADETPVTGGERLVPRGRGLLDGQTGISQGK